MRRKAESTGSPRLRILNEPRTMKCMSRTVGKTGRFLVRGWRIHAGLGHLCDQRVAWTTGSVVRVSSAAIILRKVYRGWRIHRFSCVRRLCGSVKCADATSSPILLRRDSSPLPAEGTPTTRRAWGPPTSSVGHPLPQAGRGKMAATISSGARCVPKSLILNDGGPFLRQGRLRTPLQHGLSLHSAILSNRLCLPHPLTQFYSARGARFPNS